MKYHERINTSASDQEKEDKYKKYYEQYIKEFQKTGFKDALYFEQAGPSDALVFGIKAINSLMDKSLENAVILLPRYESLREIEIHSTKWFLILWVVGSLLYVFALIFPRISLTNLNKIERGEKLPKGDFEEMFEYLIPKGEHFMTSILLLCLIVAFLYETFSGVNLLNPSSADLMALGANRRLETTEGQYWRLITSIFLHAGIMHIFLNVAGLVIISAFLEPIAGRLKYLLIFIISGLTGSIGSILWHNQTASVGASGAIFGLNGAFLALICFGQLPKEDRRSLFMMVGGYTAINLIFGLVGNIDNAAHIGGLIGGFIVTCLIFKDVPITAKILSFIIFISVAAYATHKLFIAFPQEQNIYREKMEKFNLTENQALKISKNLGEYNLSEIERREKETILLWKNCKRYVEESNELELTDNQKRRNNFLLKYSQIRLKEAQILFKVYLTHEEQYSDSLKFYNNEVDKVLKE